MITLTDATIALFLAYYWTGFEMVLFHSQLEPVDQPGYISESPIKLVISGAVWPVVSYLNREFSWFSVCFLASALVLGAAYVGLNHIIGSTFWAIIVLGVARVTPILSTIIATLLALVSALLWLVVAKPFGAKMPTGIEK